MSFEYEEEASRAAKSKESKLRDQASHEVPIVCLYLGPLPIRSEDLISRRKPLLRAYARQCRVLYLGPDPSFANTLDLISRLVRGEPAVPFDGGVGVLEPLSFLPFSRVGTINKINVGLTILLLRLFLRRQLPGYRRIMFIERPGMIWTKGLFGEDVFAYFIQDKYYAREKTMADQFKAASENRRTVIRADLVFSTSRPLHDEAIQAGANSYLTSNGVEFEVFQSAILDAKSPADICNISRPRIGLVGLLNDRIDESIVSFVADHDPTWNLIFVGPIYPDTATNRTVLGDLDRRHENLHFFGRRSYAELPFYMKEFDVCIIPYRLEGIGEGLNPLKLYQYLAVGRPVVSTPLPSIPDLNGVVSFASNPKAFALSIEKALLVSDDQVCIEKRLREAEKFSWERIAADRMRIVRGAFKS